MVEEGIEKNRINMSVAAGTGYSIPVYTVTTGRVFRMTDLIIRDTGGRVRIFDGASAASPTAAQTIMEVDTPFVATGIQNGPQFETGVTAQLVHPDKALQTYAVNVSGIEY